jgi:hypothetical protein
MQRPIPENGILNHTGSCDMILSLCRRSILIEDSLLLENVCIKCIDWIYDRLNVAVLLTLLINIRDT